MMKLLLFSSLFILTACGPGRPDLRSILEAQEGNSQFKKQNFAQARSKYLEALEHDPFLGALHLNLGLGFEFTEQVDKALQSYKHSEELALQEGNGSVLFMARFNQGQLLGKGKRIDEALEAYQRALEVIPTSVETKTNIELLTSQQGGGEGDGNDDKDKKEKPDSKDKQEPKDGQGDEDKDKPQEPKEVKQSPKYKPRPFEGKDLSEGDVKKILGELKQQEDKIRAEYNRKEVKERPRAKDW